MQEPRSWTCVMVQDGPGMLSEAIRLVLQVAAYKLSLDGFDSSRITSTVCEGYIETDWQSHLIGTRGGILFKTILTSEDGDYAVNFIISEDDLAAGKEFIRGVEESDEIAQFASPVGGRIPLDALYELLDPRISVTVN